LPNSYAYNRAEFSNASDAFNVVLTKVETKNELLLRDGILIQYLEQAGIEGDIDRFKISGLEDVGQSFWVGLNVLRCVLSVATDSNDGWSADYVLDVLEQLPSKSIGLFDISQIINYVAEFD
jgi:hypothetical protein